MTRTPVLLGPFPPPAGGVATFFMRLCALLDEQNCAFRLKRFGGAEDPIAATWSSWQTNLGDVQPGDILLDSGTSFLEYPSRKPMVMWLVWRFMKRFRWVKILHSGTLPARYAGFSAQQKLLFRLNLRLVDEFVCVSDPLADWLADAMKVQQPILRVSSLLPLPKVHRQTMFDLPAADFRVVTVGIFTDNYGFDEIIQALTIVRQRTGRDIQLIILDAAFDRDESYRERVSRGQSWLHAFEALPAHHVLSIMKQSDVFIRATRQESYGLSKVEALLSGLSVICTPVGETRGMTTYPPGNVDELVARIIQKMQSAATTDANEWQTFYQQLADDNLAQFINILYGNVHA